MFNLPILPHQILLYTQQSPYHPKQMVGGVVRIICESKSPRWTLNTTDNRASRWSSLHYNSEIRDKQSYETQSCRGGQGPPRAIASFGMEWNETQRSPSYCWGVKDWLSGPASHTPPVSQHRQSQISPWSSSHCLVHQGENRRLQLAKNSLGFQGFGLPGSRLQRDYCIWTLKCQTEVGI
jgi:hypothetical protein